MCDMKDSGVEWLGCIPEDYNIASIGSLFTIKKDIIGREPETVLSITQTGVKPKDLTSNEGQNASSYVNYQIVNVGDFAMNHMDLLTGWIDISKYEGVTSPDYRVFTLNDKEMTAEYFLRVFQHYYSNKVFFGFGQGVATLGRWRLPAINFKRIEIPVPPIEEQKKIVRAIDESVGKIEKLKENVQAQIEKLKAYKQSLITEVVTKGLDPNISMKDSGVEWIGEIPEHWNVIATKHLFNILSGATPKSEIIENWDGKITWITPADYKTEDVYVSEGRRNISETGFQSCSTSLIPSNSIIFSKRAPIGAVAINTKELCTNQGCLSCVNKDEKVNYVKYFYYVMAIATKQYELLGSGTTFKEISASVFSNFLLPRPAMEEQIMIVEYLDNKCSNIDRLIAIKQSKIEKLEQYKRSIIYEYVTGKREVS